MPNIINYSRAIYRCPQNTRATCPQTCLEVQKVQKPDLFDLTVKEVLLYTILAFRKHMSLLWANFLHCLSSVGKCVTMVNGTETSSLTSTWLFLVLMTAVGARPGGLMPNAVVPALNARNAVLYRNLNALLTALRTHVHPVTSAPGATGVGGTPPLGVPPIVLVLERSLLNGNGTDEDNNFSKNWINETLKESNLTEEQVNLKHFILSDEELTSRVFGPVIMEELEKMNTDRNSGKIFIAK